MAKDIRHYKRYCAIICWQGLSRIPKDKVKTSMDYARYAEAWFKYCEEALEEEIDKKGPQGGGNPGGP